jgi:hypothetical protein
MTDDNQERERAAAWRARMVAAMSNLDLDATAAQYGDRLGDAADALAELESVRTICAWTEHQATSMANIIERNQGREVRTMEMMLMALGDKGLKSEPISEIERMRFMVDIMGRLASIRSEAMKSGMSFAVQMLAETRAYFSQIAIGHGGPNADVLSVLTHACMIGEMRKSVLEDELDEDEANDSVAPCIEALLDKLTSVESEVKS